jgi:hypothetical protein
MKERTRSIQELRDTRVKTTFKVEITLDLPYFDNHSCVNQRLSEAIEEILHRVNKNDTDGHFEQEDCYQMGHKVETFYGYEEEEEYNIHDWDI